MFSEVQYAENRREQEFEKADEDYKNRIKMTEIFS